jgi:hypothetical protein
MLSPIWIERRLLQDIQAVSDRIQYDRVTVRLTNLYRELKNPMSAIDRIRAKALQARNVAGEALTSFEGELDSIIAEKDVIKRRVAEASAPHHEILKGIHGEIDGLKSAIDLLSNGAPGGPLPGSGVSGDHLPDVPFDINTRRDRPRA